MKDPQLREKAIEALTRIIDLLDATNDLKELHTIFQLDMDTVKNLSVDKPLAPEEIQAVRERSADAIVEEAVEKFRGIVGAWAMAHDKAVGVLNKFPLAVIHFKMSVDDGIMEDIKNSVQEFRAASDKTNGARLEDRIAEMIVSASKISDSAERFAHVFEFVSIGSIVKKYPLPKKEMMHEPSVETHGADRG